MSGHAYRVGDPYHPTRRSWPELAQYQYRGGGHELVLFLRQPTSREVRAARQGLASFAFYADQDLLVLLYAFGDGLPWSDAPYSWHLVPKSERVLPPETRGEERALLSLVLVDATTGIIRALRVVTLTPTFTRLFHDAIREQAARPWPGAAAYDAELAALYQRYPSTAALLAVSARDTGR